MSSTGIIDLSLRVNTTKAKIKVLRTLQGYWKIKGTLLQNKLDPTYGPLHPEMYRDIAMYITEYTDLPQRSTFWNLLTSEKQDLFCRALIFSDEVPTKFGVIGSESGATLCIVLNGFANVESSLSKGSKATYCQGQCFGEFFHFDELTRFETAGCPSYDPVLINRPDGIEEILDVVMEKGALLHIHMDTFKHLVWGHKVPEPVEIELDLRTDEEISGIPVGSMTTLDFTCVRVHRAAKKKLASVLYDFMTNTDLLPRNAYAASTAGLLKTAAKYSSIYISSRTAYIVLDGTLRVDIVKKGARVKQATIGTINADGDPDNCMKIKTRRLPLCSMDIGSILYLDEPCFVVGQDIAAALLPTGAMKPQFRAHLEESRKSGMLPCTPQNPLLLPRKDKKGRIVNDGVKADILYQLTAEFERSTTYLQVPEHIFRTALGECPAHTSESFNAQLSHSSEWVFGRISRLLPWITGKHFGIEPESPHLVSSQDDAEIEDRWEEE